MKKKITMFLLFFMNLSTSGNNIFIHIEQITQLNTFIWAFECNEKHNLYADKFEEYLESVIDDEEFSPYFQVLERKKYIKLYNLAKTERGLQGIESSIENLKVENATTAFTGSISYSEILGSVEIKIELFDIYRTVSIGSGYINLTNDEMSDREKTQAKIKKLINKEIIPKLSDNTKYFNSNPLNNAIEMLAKSVNCRETLQTKFEQGILVSNDDQIACNNLRDNALAILNELQEQGNIQAITHLIGYYETYYNNVDVVDNLKEHLRKRISERILHAESLIVKGEQCTKITKARGDLTYEAQRECFLQIKEGVVILDNLVKQGHIEAISPLIAFYERNTVRKKEYSEKILELQEMLKKNN